MINDEALGKGGNLQLVVHPSLVTEFMADMEAHAIGLKTLQTNFQR